MFTAGTSPRDRTRARCRPGLGQLRVHAALMILSLSLPWPYRVRATGRKKRRARTTSGYRINLGYAPALFHLRLPRRADVASSPGSAPPCAAPRSGRMAPTPECFVQSSSPSNVAVLRTRGE